MHSDLEAPSGERGPLTDLDLHLFNEGTHFRIWEKLGCHPGRHAGESGFWFAVWAPNARAVSVVGDFNSWNPLDAPMSSRASSGVWETFLPGVRPGQAYKFHIRTKEGTSIEKADPYARRSEVPPKTASLVHDAVYEWGDEAWMHGREARQSLDRPMSIYELHPGSWAPPEREGDRWPGWRELAPRVAEHIAATGFTHVELMPVMEHPFYGSWGYQVTGYFSPTGRYGTPEDLKYFIDFLHQREIGVILDWVPSHFPTDGHGLGWFDGTHLYEHADPRLGFHPDWSSWIFNYGRHEVRCFLISSAKYWLEEFHADGLRVDAVASMLYRDYSREEGEWIPNEHGGRENLDAVYLLRRMNEEAYGTAPGVQTVAEESTAWPAVTKPTYIGGLGFGLKWDMGWMHDILRYMGKDPVHRRWHHNDLTFRQLYAFSENFVLSFSHDEVVHGKGSLWDRMAGDEWQKFANLRLLYGLMYAQPGKKLLFMGAEFAQRREWNHEGFLDWQLLDEAPHAGVMRWLGDLNRLYREEPALYELDCDPTGFEWIAPDDNEQSVISFLRRSRDGQRSVLVICNFSPVPRAEYQVGVPVGGMWEELLCSDAEHYGGSGWGNLGGVEAERSAFHGRPWSLSVALPPLGAVFLLSVEDAES
ncbi:MAG: 1,4-alpha-glucan branching protein GlgB [marine benthic group bacterium]|jgi:1,4-alpha-glucan branching enzyme|nr:1,4-alpha-glucan branching protein GlgB [Gemmatimonadota bacterium]MCL7962075.1 1,4-alpha-glucan branching protein GlgB [Candidatus Carthagonibacter metallireducens]MCL7958500.1 1,4-alpha-glucan branching protein GlgB [Gemmatimonadota bacterium]MCL7965177.1 1,4-alpha-glucan branching protein GlgB [Gemmatimonadota bacterium]MCL7967675.1 1,4-alpha-glucan branching protein GlgB [Gemmatimonadota bacterium]